MKKFDFSGWATKNDLVCSDGRVIRKDAFKHNDGAVVPLVWNHQHNDPFNILGHAALENRPDGVYAFCTFNDTDQGVNVKKLVQHGDVCALSIYANKLKQVGSDVVHGAIREVSIVLAGANPGAGIEAIMEHSEDGEDEVILYSGEQIELFHAEEDGKKSGESGKPKAEDANGDKTLKDVLDTFTEEQKIVLHALIGHALEQGDTEDEEEEDTSMKHNVFDKDDDKKGNTLTHNDIDMEAVLKDAKRLGSLKESFLSHADGQDYGIENIGYLFPDAKTVTNTPDFIQREMGWVQEVMSGVHHTPFSRIKSVHANITEDEARARGYMKGKLKKEEVFVLLKRTTDPQTVYKKQKLDRDDIVDITDLDVVAWVKMEMRMMLDEELARAYLIGDGRMADSDDKIKPEHIRPIWTDADLYCIKADVEVAPDATDAVLAKAFEYASVKTRKDYKGSGSPTLFTTEDMLTSMLLREDTIGHKIYKSRDELATALLVKKIVTVPVMENLTRTRADRTEVALLGLIVNLTDYNVGADKGGAVNMFEDFDIDYNQEKYLIETRCSGALTRPYSAIALERVAPVDP